MFKILEIYSLCETRQSYFKLFKHIPSLGIYNFSKMADIL